MRENFHCRLPECSWVRESRELCFLRTSHGVISRHVKPPICHYQVKDSVSGEIVIHRILPLGELRDACFGPETFPVGEYVL